MESPWKILNLDPGSASEKDVKVAYAKLIKLHRPDEDPEGFQRVREAYEIGLTMVRDRPSAPTSPVAEPPSVEEPSPEATTLDTAPSEPLPPSLMDAESAVARAREVGDADTVRKTVGALFYVCRAIKAGRAGIRIWQESLHRVTGGSSELVAQGVTTSQLIAELEAGYSILCHACLGHWEAARDLAAIRQLGEGILTESKRVDADEAAIVALRIGLEIGFAAPATAMKLVHFAFPHLQREARDQYVPQVDQQVQLGGFFTGFREDQMEFWHRRFRRPQAEVSWSDPAAEAALEYISSARPPAWDGFDLLPKIASSEWMARLQGAMRRKHGGLIGRFRPLPLGSAHGVRPRVSKRRRVARVLLLAMAAYLGLAALVAVYSNSSRNSPGHASARLAAKQGAASNGASLQPVSDLGLMKMFTPATDYAKGRQQCDARSTELKAISRVSSWQNMLLTMHKNDADPEWQGANKIGSKEQAFRVEVQRFFKSLADSDPAVEPQVLELLVMDRSVPPILKQEAVFRQVQILPFSTLIAFWKAAATASPAQEELMARAADWYLKHHGQDLTIGEADRRELEILIRNGIKVPG